jgi:hypothetical protein
MTSGTCPKCKPPSVYQKSVGISFGDSGFHVYTGGASRPLNLDHYACTTCGYFESYFSDANILQDVAKSWTPAGRPWSVVGGKWRVAIEQHTVNSKQRAQPCA